MMTEEELFRIKIEKPNENIKTQVQKNWDHVAKPIDGLGVFEKITSQIGAICGSADIQIKRKAVIVMCADNGIVAEGVSQSGQDVSTIVTRFMGKNQTSVGKMARVAGADIIVTDIGLASHEKMEGVRDRKVAYGTKNFLHEPAMTREEVLKAIEIGVDTVHLAKDEGYQLLGTGEMGIGNTTTSSAIAAVLTGYDVNMTTGRGAGLSDQGLKRKREVISQALCKYGWLQMDGTYAKTRVVEPGEVLRVLQTVGGLDIAGLAGVYIGGAISHIPVVIDGVISAVAALVAQRLVPGVREYVIPSHRSKEPAMKAIMDMLQVEPVIDAGLALGEGTGAVMMFSLLDMAMALYESETTFGKMQVEQYERF